MAETTKSRETESQTGIKVDNTTSSISRIAHANHLPEEQGVRERAASSVLNIAILSPILVQIELDLVWYFKV